MGFFSDMSDAFFGGDSAGKKGKGSSTRGGGKARDKDGWEGRGGSTTRDTKDHKRGPGGGRQHKKHGKTD